MARDYTAVPHGYLEECEMLTDEEFGQLMRGLLRYSRDGTPIEAEGNGSFFARRMMNQEDLNRRRYSAKCHGRRPLPEPVREALGGGSRPADARADGSG